MFIDLNNVGSKIVNSDVKLFFPDILEEVQDKIINML